MTNSDAESQISNASPTLIYFPRYFTVSPFVQGSHQCVRWAPRPGGPARWCPRQPGQRGRSRRRQLHPRECRRAAAWLWWAPPECPLSPQTGWSGCTPRTSSWGRQTLLTGQLSSSNNFTHSSASIVLWGLFLACSFHNVCNIYLFHSG